MIRYSEIFYSIQGEKDFDYSAIQYHGKTKNYKKTATRK